MAIPARLLGLVLLALSLGAVARPLDPRAVELIIEYEVGSPARYDARYQRPVWPPYGQSGVTIGVGYDLGHQFAHHILADWRAHPQRSALLDGAGIRGEEAREAARRMQHIVTRWPLARDVFLHATLVTYENRMRLCFGRGVDRLRSTAYGALVSLVYNRGCPVSGDRGLEMRVIRDTCVPDADHACIAAQIRRMIRLWRGTTIADGMARRREAEARLVEIR